MAKFLRENLGEIWRRLRWWLVQICNADWQYYPTKLIHNRISTSVFDCPDTVANLQTALILQVHTSNTRPEYSCMVHFSFSSLETLNLKRKLYGISGASGVHPCLWCVSVKMHMATEPSHRPSGQSMERTLQPLAKDQRRKWPQDQTWQMPRTLIM